jgi:hypothetical protein
MIRAVGLLKSLLAREGHVGVDAVVKRCDTAVKCLGEVAGADLACAQEIL